LIIERLRIVIVHQHKSIAVREFVDQLEDPGVPLCGDKAANIDFWDFRTLGLGHDLLLAVVPVAP